MKLAGSKPRACLSGWISAALLLMGLNAYQFISLEQKPLEGYAPALKMLQAKMARFNSTTAFENYDLNGRIDFIATAAEPYVTIETDPNSPALASQPGGGGLPSNPFALPTLSGIIQTVDPKGMIRFQALLNGKICRRQDHIDGFTVADITPQGVVVRRSGLTWIIQSPRPLYSTDQGE